MLDPAARAYATRFSVWSEDCELLEIIMPAEHETV